MPRPPASLIETLTANARPQPAIPAVLVAMITVVYVASATPDASTSATWIAAAGVVASCALAVAAGFCSVVPPLAWLAVIWLGIGEIRVLKPPNYAEWAVYAGTAVAAATLLLQLWRVRTGRFVPTIADDGPAASS